MVIRNGIAGAARARRGGVAALAVVASLLAVPGAARGQGDASAEAQRLFLEGRAAIERGDYATGCPRFAESLRLLTRASTLLNLAQCEEHEGDLRGALEHWTQGACAPESCVNEMYTAPSTCQAGACVPGSTGPCPSGQACGNASACSPCIKCNQWLTTPTDPMTVNWCPGSQAKYQALHDCACGGACDECLSSLLCNDLLVLTPGCQTCIQSSCPNQEDACKADAPLAARAGLLGPPGRVRASRRSAA